MSRRKLFKHVMMIVMLCVSMWQLPQFIGAIDAAKNPKKMSEFLDGLAPPGQPPGNAAPRSTARAGTPQSEIFIYSPHTGAMSDEERDRLAERAKRLMPRSDTTPPKRAKSGGQRKTPEQTISDALDELNRGGPN